MSSKYKNRTIINQRGGSIDIDNSTDKEKIQISHRSGSNLNFTNVVTSELASNNKQLNVINDSYKTVGGTDSEYISKDKIERIGENSFSFKGVSNENEIELFKKWKTTFQKVANSNAKFRINRGGISFPNGPSTSLEGSRTGNPVIRQAVTVVENNFGTYDGVPIRDSRTDAVVDYDPVTTNRIRPAASVSITTQDLIEAAGSTTGSRAPGVLEFGPGVSAATEGGQWTDNVESSQLDKAILEIQSNLNDIEKELGNGGDDILFIKRNKSETVGAIFNDYPSLRIDPKGRSQPFEMVVSKTAAFKNHDYVPIVEDVDNSSIFPCGVEDKIVGNKYNLNVGSGGINLKSTGTIEMGGSSLKMGFQKINMSAPHGIHLHSNSIIEINSLKTISLRTNRQVYVESSLGVNKNIIIGGGMYTEGEVYIHHITAPIEIQQTIDTILYGKFNCTAAKSLAIGEVYDPEHGWLTVYALPDDDLIANYPHSHHFANLPLRLCDSNSDVRKFARNENINVHGSVSPALAQSHARRTNESTV